MKIKSLLEQEILIVFRSLVEGNQTKIEKEVDEDLYVIGEVNRHKEVIIRIGGCSYFK